MQSVDQLEAFHEYSPYDLAICNEWAAVPKCAEVFDIAVRPLLGATGGAWILTTDRPGSQMREMYEPQFDWIGWMGWKGLHSLPCSPYLRVPDLTGSRSAQMYCDLDGDLA